MVKITDIYLEYLKQKGNSSKRAYRLPKEPELSIEKLRQTNQANYDKLKTLTDHFNTKWSNIDPQKYLQTGFILFANFSYPNFLNDKILKHYIQLNKIEKFHTEFNRKTLLKSFKFIKEYMKENNIHQVSDYCGTKSEYRSLVLEHFFKGNVDPFTLLYLMLKKYVTYTQEEKDKLYDFLNNVTKYKPFVMEEWNLFMKMEKTINESLLITDPPSGNLILGDKTIEEIEEEKKNFNKMKLLEN